MTTMTETFANRWFSASFNWKGGLLTGIDLLSLPLTETQPCSPFGNKLAQIVHEYDVLQTDAWPSLPLDTSSLSSFTLLVLEQLRTGTPRGTWTTYGKLAQACGSPHGARAVGGVMARNPWPLLYPCHRVLASDHGLGGFGPGIELKRTLLTLENALAP